MERNWIDELVIENENASGKKSGPLFNNTNEPKRTQRNILWLLEEFSRREMVRYQDPNESDKHFIICPNEASHSSTNKTEAFLRTGEGERPACVHCSHGSCTHVNTVWVATLWNLADKLAGETQSDLGNAQRYVDVHRNQLRYAVPQNEWWAYDGTKWVRDADHIAMQLAMGQAEGMLQEAARSKNEGAIKWALKSQEANRIQAVVKLARSFAELVVGREVFDADTALVVTPNGTYDSRTGGMRAHDLADYDTRMTGARYAPEARCPVWRNFLEQVLPDPEVRRYLQKCLGYSLTGNTTEKCFFVCWGPPDCGKTTLLQAWARVVGAYGAAARPELVLAKREGEVPNELAALAGKRFVYMSETDENRRLATAQVKALTGQDAVKARFFRQEWFEFQPQFKIWMATNHKPTIRESGDAIWNRVRLIPFTERFPEERQDKRLPEKLLGEIDGMLAWGLEGLRLWQQEGLPSPVAVKKAGREYREEMDLFDQFLEEACVRGETFEASSSGLHRAYVEWCRLHGEATCSQRMFSQWLERSSFTKRKAATGMFWKGLRLASYSEREGYDERLGPPKG